MYNIPLYAKHQSMQQTTLYKTHLFDKKPLCRAANKRTFLIWGLAHTFMVQLMGADEAEDQNAFYWDTFDNDHAKTWWQALKKLRIDWTGGRP